MVLCDHLSVESGPPDEDLGKLRQCWRDITLKVNDGLVSTFLLVMGVAGGGLSSMNILLTAIAGVLAGAVSLFAGEYVATKSQNEVLNREITPKRTQTRENQRDELSEVEELLKLIGISDQQRKLRADMLTFYGDHPDAMSRLITTLKFGVIGEKLRSPIRAGATSCFCFILGSLPSVIPFAFNVSSTVGLIYAACFTITSLFIVGAVKTWATRGNCFSAAMENLVNAGFGGGICYGVGVLFDSIVRG